MITLALPHYVLVSHVEAFRIDVFLVLVVHSETSLTSLGASEGLDRSYLGSMPQRRHLRYL